MRKFLFSILVLTIMFVGTSTTHASTASEAKKTVKLLNSIYAKGGENIDKSLSEAQATLQNIRTTCGANITQATKAYPSSSFVLQYAPLYLAFVPLAEGYKSSQKSFSKKLKALRIKNKNLKELYKISSYETKTLNQYKSFDFCTELNRGVADKFSTDSTAFKPIADLLKTKTPAFNDKRLQKAVDILQKYGLKKAVAKNIKQGQILREYSPSQEKTLENVLADLYPAQ